MMVIGRGHNHGINLTMESDFNEPINLGNPDEFTILRLAEMVIDITGSSSKLVYMPLPADDPRQRQPDITLAQQTLEWKPRVRLETGLRRTCDYFERLLRQSPYPVVTIP